MRSAQTSVDTWAIMKNSSITCLTTNIIATINEQNMNKKLKVSECI